MKARDTASVEPCQGRIVQGRLVQGRVVQGRVVQSRVVRRGSSIW